MRRRCLGESQVVVAVRRPHRLGHHVAPRQQLPGRVVADALQQPVPVVGVIPLDQTLVHERQDLIEHRSVLPGDGDEVGAVEVKPAGEHRQALEQFLLGRVKQIIRPVDQGLEGLLARQCGAVSAGEESESLIQPFLNLVDGHGAKTRGGELDRQRDPVKATAQPCHGVAVVRVEREVRTLLTGTINEKANRF